MAYIGKTPVVGNFQICDAISVVNGQAAYTLQVGGANVIPESANHMIVSLSGVIQKPGSSYTVSGSTITFSQNLVTGDVIDFIQILGNVLDIGTPSDATVTTAKLGDSAVTTAKLGSNAVSSAKMFSGFANGITEADQWRLTANTNSGTDADVTSNWERNDNSGWSGIGTGLTESSGIFSFPQTGIYLIYYVSRVQASSGDSSVNYDLKITLNNSSYDTVARTGNGNRGSGAAIGSSSNTFLFDVTDTSNCKFKFTTESFDSGTLLSGSTTAQHTGFTVIRLGDT